MAENASEGKKNVRSVTAEQCCSRIELPEISYLLLVGLYAISPRTSYQHFESKTLSILSAKKQKLDKQISRSRADVYNCHVHVCLTPKSAFLPLFLGLVEISNEYNGQIRNKYLLYMAIIQILTKSNM